MTGAENRKSVGEISRKEVEHPGVQSSDGKEIGLLSADASCLSTGDKNPGS